ncbi:MAG: EAL domain-containing protein [Micavibrio sp.]
MTSKAWLDHLSHTLTDNGLIAYIWNLDQDRFEWQGDLQTLLGIEDGKHPQNGAHFNKLINPQDVPQRLAVIHNAVRALPTDGGDAETFLTSYRIRRTNGMQVDVQESGSLHTDPATGEKILCGFMRIVDQDQFVQSLGRATAQPGAQRLSFTSFEGGLAHEGRQDIIRKIQEWGDSNNPSNAVGYLLAVGIDRVSMFNEAFGAQFTDELIEKTGKRLQQMMSDHGVMARIDGDVFALFFRDAPHSEMAAVAHYILNAFYESPLRTSKGPIGVGISMGGILVRQKTVDCADLLTKAEMAMQSAKDRGRGRFVSYNEVAGEGQATRMILQSGDAFMTALKDNRVKLAFQPVVHSQTSEVSFHESLIRFIDEQGKVHSAGEFIPAIEKLGLSRLVDRYALRLAIHELGMFSNLELSVNVSNLTLTDPDWLRGLVAALRDQPQMASRLIIEITESAAMYDMSKTVRIIKTLRDLGCRVALDDFGSGYTAFSQLKQLDIDMVKIDKTFIRNIEEKENHLFVKTLQALADGVEIETVGEGAETMSEARMLASDGVNHIQGYAFGFPSVERVWLPKDHLQRKLIISKEESRDMGSDMLAEDLSGDMMDIVRRK